MGSDKEPRQWCGKACASALDPQMDGMGMGEEKRLWSHSWRVLGGLFLAHIRPPDLSFLDPSTLSSQPPHKRALCRSAKRCQMHLYSLASPSPPPPEPWLKHCSARCRKQEERGWGPDVSQRSDGNVSPAFPFSSPLYSLLPPP